MQNQRKRVLLAIVIGTGIISLVSCGRSSASDSESMGVSDMDSAESGAANVGMASGIAGTDATGRGTADTGEDGAPGSGTGEDGMGTASSQGLPEGTESEPGQEFSESAGAEEDTVPMEIPQLPHTAKALADFVPEGWEILDSVELDFNEDGIPDYVGVLEAVPTDAEDAWYSLNPRILFAVASDGADGYRLDFQDINLIRSRAEGGVFGDPYMPLTAEGTSFTTHAYGGSAWRWSEDYTYTCQEGIWRLTASESAYGYGSYTTSYSRNDWLSGVGIRKERSSEFSDMEKIWDNEEDWGSEVYDLEYELPLDGPVTLEQAAKRWWLARNRVTDWEVASVTCVAEAKLSEDKVKHPDEAYLDYCDEDCALYAFSDGDSSLYYLAMYRWEDRSLSVLAQEEAAIDYPEIYKGRIYYATDIVETVRYKTWQDGKEQTVEEEDTVGVRLNRMVLDGTGKETVFEYRYLEEGQEIQETRIPYLSLLYEIGGDQIVAEVYIGGQPHPFYRMKTDGSGLDRIGQVPVEQE